jgi:hypothetical protein
MNRTPQENYEPNGFRFGQMNRKQRRVGVLGFIGDLADDNLLVGGEIEDISMGGFKLTNIPESFGADKLYYTVILTGGGRHYRLLAKPCWRKKGLGQSRVELGFKIIDAPWEWVELALSMIPEFYYEDHFGFQA